MGKKLNNSELSWLRLGPAPYAFDNTAESSSGSLDVVLFCWLRERRPRGDVMFFPCCQAGVREASAVLSRTTNYSNRSACTS